eukprot:CAMPEP_0114540402 /NCGR_PEP_ID=MMETSP0114-20121206/746_1 /TAXON_ID=31324 /ORGANISM="Goniomonas sp, Strain m" /LENGTH=97 /DNA_ID=CAMNT_0001724557 /DNA_START=557 /DNA_END=850 /DNA_ORIENTATION=+
MTSDGITSTTTYSRRSAVVGPSSTSVENHRLYPKSKLIAQRVTNEVPATPAAARCLIDWNCEAEQPGFWLRTRATTILQTYSKNPTAANPERPATNI